MDFTRPKRCRRQRTGREDRHSNFYENPDNLADIWDDPSRMPHVDLPVVERVWPVVVVSEGLFHNPTIWEYIQSHTGHYLRFPHSEVSAVVKPVVLLDLEELELLMGMITEGLSATDVLERKVSELWANRDFKALVFQEYGSRWSGQAKFVTQEQHRAFKAIVNAIDLRGMREAEAAQRLAA